MGWDYRKNLQAKGQNDKFACWAASISWWLEAMSLQYKRRILTQNELISKFDSLCDENGAMPISNLRKVCENAEVRMELRYVTPAYFAKHYKKIDSPIMIVFNYPKIGGTHMNVVFDQTSSSLQCMEPYYPYPGKDGQRTGQYVRRPVSFFSGSQEIGIGYLPLADAFKQDP